MTKEEAIKRIKARFDKWALDDKDIKAIQTLIPELHESEDERIRNGLLHHFKNKMKPYWNELAVKDIVAYLEKQKAKERFDRMAPIYNDKESFESALEKAWKFYNESASRTVDSFEDDYIECVFSKGFREGFLYKEKQKEQKPTEWSEEDESQLDDIEKAISNYFDLNHAPQYHYWLEEKLKSLRPSWKPSEEQMRALQVVVDEHWDVDGDALYSLYTDLKELM